jgi:hypothetical protein
MTTIFEEFRALADNSPEIENAIDILETGMLPTQEAKRLAFHVWRTIVPIPPAGKRLTRSGYWGQADTRYVWKGLYGYKDDSHAKWMREQRVSWERKGMTAPACYFEPRAVLPAPNPRAF